MKHDPKDKAEFDMDGKDSKRFFDSGTDTLVVSPTRTTIFKHSPSEFEAIIAQLDFDLLIVEGLKNWDLPRISLFRDKIDESYFEVSKAVALSDEMSQYKNVIPSGVSVFDLDDVDSICGWILDNAKVLKG